MGAKIRIFKLAKELNIASDTLISFLHDIGYDDVKNINSPIDDVMYDKVIEHFKVEKSHAEKKEIMRIKRAQLRGEVAESVKKDVTGKKTAEVTERPAIIDAIRTFQRAEVVETASVKEIAEVSVIEETTSVKKPKKVKGKKTKEEKPVETAPIEEISVEKPGEAVHKVEKIPAAKGKITIKLTEEKVPAPGAEVEIGVEQDVYTAPVDTAEIPTEEVSPAIKTVELEAVKIITLEEEIEPKKGQIVGKIELPEEKPRKEKIKRFKEGREAERRPRRLSVKGQGIAEKIRKQKTKELVVGIQEEEEGELVYRRARKRKRAKKKKIDSKEVEAAVKETLAKMEESSELKKYKKKVKTKEEAEVETNVLEVPEYISVAELSQLMNVETNDVIKKFLELGMIVSINQRLDMDTISTVADEFGYEIHQLEEYGEGEEEFEEEEEDNFQICPPVVTIMGHVDHGKTSLLDCIRRSNIVAGEKGGITQHIGAYEVEVEGKRVTFLDTPGHEAFTAMRARGAQVTDIVVLVVAADDNVMPQTLEALNHAQAAGVPIIIAINKIDKPEANSDRIKQQLADHKVLVESWGGKYQSVEISAKKGTNIDRLLETILFQAELMELAANPNGRIKGTVIESKLDKGKGIICTILVQNGTMKVGDFFICGQHHGHVKAMFNERGKRIDEAPPSSPVQILGFSGMPQVGDVLVEMESDKDAKVLSYKRQQLKREHEYRATRARTLYDLSKQIQIGSVKELLIILKGDTNGSVEALEDSFLKMSMDEVEVRVIHKSTGAITEADVLLASASQAIIIGFNVSPNLNARNLAAREGVDIRLYEIIYNAIEDVKAALEGMLEPEITEEVESTIEVRNVFQVLKVGTIAGCYVASGKVVRNSRVRLIRDGAIIFTGTIASLKRFKDDAKEVASGFECGIRLDKFNDIKIGDILETFKKVEVKRVLSN